MLKRSVWAAWVCGWMMAASAQAAVDWDAKIRAQLLPSSKPATTLSLTSTPARLPRRDVTTALAAARAHWDELSDETRRLASMYLQRPFPSEAVVSVPGFSEASWAFDVDQESTLDSSELQGSHFRIHYINKETNSGNPKAATPAYAMLVASVLENVYEAQHGQLQYGTVPSDTTATFNGGDSRFDVYLTELGSAGLYGYVVPEGASSDTARPYGEYSYMVLDNDYSLDPYGYVDSTLPLQVTAAHEYFHAVQFGYSAQEDDSGFAFLEQASTWMEDVVYPNVHDNYFYLGEPFTDTNGNGQYNVGEPYTDRNGSGTRDDGSAEYPEAPLDAFNDVPTIQYGRFVWFHYLEENHGVGIVKTIFEKCGQVAGDNMLSAINESLQGFGTNLATAYQDYAAWNYDLSNYDDGANYPLVYVDRTATGDNFSMTSAASPSLGLWKQGGYNPHLHLSTVYNHITSPSGTIRYESSGGTAALTMLVDFGGGNIDHDVVALTNGDATWTVPSGAVKVIAVISNVATATDGMSWTLQGSGYRETKKKDDGFFGAISLLDVVAIVLVGGFARKYRAARRSQS